MAEIYKGGGIKNFYKGIDSAITRQIFYTTTRMGVYKTLFNQEKKKNEGKNLSFG